LGSEAVEEGVYHVLPARMGGNIYMLTYGG